MLTAVYLLVPSNGAAEAFRIPSASDSIYLLSALALVTGLAIQSRFRSPAPLLMMVGVGVLVIADVLRTVEELRDGYGAGSFVAAAVIPASLFIGAAALDPTMKQMNRAVEAGPAFGLGRVVWLSVAALTPLTVLLTLLVTGWVRQRRGRSLRSVRWSLSCSRSRGCGAWSPPCRV